MTKTWKAKIRLRDRDRCRYCGKTVSPNGAGLRKHIRRVHGTTYEGA